MKLENKVAIVTGSSRGIGEAIAKTFAREGARVVVNYVRNARRANRVAEQIRALGRDAISIGADVSQRSQALNLVSKTVSAFGGLDILVNNAGLLVGGTIFSTKENQWDRAFEVNLKVPFNCIQAAAEVMSRQKSGKIINVSSISGLGGAPKGELAYSCSKAALMHLTRLVALDLGPYGVNVNCIAPGWTLTDMVIRSAGSQKRLEELNAIKARQAAIGRIGDPQDIANLALFLASEESSFITGQVIVADGGRQDFVSHG